MKTTPPDTLEAGRAGPWCETGSRTYQGEAFDRKKLIRKAANTRLSIRVCPVADESHAKSLRQYAHTWHDHKNPGLICVSEAFLDLPKETRDGLLAHEVGHILAGPTSSEPAADEAFRTLTGVRILYRDTEHGSCLQWIPKEFGELLNGLLKIDLSGLSGMKRNGNGKSRWRLRSIKKSDKKGKKYVATFEDRDTGKKKTTHFGAAGYSDFTKHKDQKRKARYLARHECREDWSDPTTPGALSRWILWGEPSMKQSVTSFKRKFRLNGDVGLRRNVIVDSDALAQRLYEAMPFPAIELQRSQVNLSTSDRGHPVVDEPERYRWFLIKEFPVRHFGLSLGELLKDAGIYAGQERSRHDRIVDLLRDAPAWPAIVTADGILIDGYHRIAANHTLRRKTMPVIVAVDRSRNDFWDEMWIGEEEDDA